ARNGTHPRNRTLRTCSPFLLPIPVEFCAPHPFPQFQCPQWYSTQEPHPTHPLPIPAAHPRRAHSPYREGQSPPAIYRPP
ncbi:hypothetical protein DXG01_000772, partial [Tephrocybe rancida]